MNALLGGNLDEYRIPSPILGDEAELRKLLLYPLGVRVREVYLVYGDYYRDAGGLGMVYGLYCLRHHAVVGGHYEHDYVRGPGAARPHCGERLMAGRIEECDIALFKVHMIGAYVLGYAAGLAADDIRLPYGVEKRGLSVVDMPHYRYYRRPELEIAYGGLLVARLHKGLFLHGHALDLVVIVLRYERDGVEVYKLVDCGHDTEAHQFLYDLSGLHSEFLREVGNAYGVEDAHDPFGGLGNRYLGLLHRAARSGLPPLLAVLPSLLLELALPAGRSARRVELLELRLLLEDLDFLLGNGLLLGLYGRLFNNRGVLGLFLRAFLRLFQLQLREDLLGGLLPGLLQDRPAGRRGLLFLWHAFFDLALGLLIFLIRLRDSGLCQFSSLQNLRDSLYRVLSRGLCL